MNAVRPPDGYNVGVNVGAAGGQGVPHVHIHLIPRYRGDVLLIHMWSKEILDHGWYLHNASIGAPFPGPPE